MKLYLTKEVILSGGPADGSTQRIPPNRQRLALRNEKKNDRMVYEYDRMSADGREVFVLALREPLVVR